MFGWNMLECHDIAPFESTEPQELEKWLIWKHKKNMQHMQHHFYQCKQPNKNITNLGSFCLQLNKDFTEKNSTPNPPRSPWSQRRLSPCQEQLLPPTRLPLNRLAEVRAIDLLGAMILAMRENHGKPTKQVTLWDGNKQVMVRGFIKMHF